MILTHNLERTTNLDFLRLDSVSTSLLHTTRGLTNVGALLTRAKTHGSLTDTTSDTRTRTDVTSVHSAGDAVLGLDVQLGENVTRTVDGSSADITDSSSLNHVADNETLNSLILGDAAATVGAADSADVTTALAVLTTVTALLGHFGSCEMKRLKNKMKNNGQDILEDMIDESAKDKRLR